MHNNTYSTGSPYADINLPSGSYVLSADFSQSSQKCIELYVDGAWIKNIENGQAFEIDDTKVSRFRFAPTTQGTWKVTDIKVMNYNAVDIKDLSQQVQNVGELVSRKSFVGIGDTYTSTLITGLQPSGKYRCYIHNKQWKRSEISIGGNYGFNIASEVNGAFVDLVIRTTLELSTLADYYDFVIPSNSNGTIRIGGRADVGEEVQFSVINISDIIMQGSTDMDFISKVAPINVFDARSFVTTNTTNWTLTLLKDYIRVTHNNTYSTGSPYSPLELSEGEYLFAADFSEATLQKHIDLYKNGAWYKNLTNGVTFEIEKGASYELSYAPSAQGTSIVKNISIVKASLLPLDISVDGALLTQHCNNLNKDADVDSFLFFTDPHLLNEGLIDLGRSTYIQTIKAYADNLPINNVICGGDWINNFADIKDAARCLGYINGYMSNAFANYQLIVGNHEYNKYIEGQEALSVKAIRNLYTKREKNYYTFDSALSRFIVFDSGIDTYNHLMDDYKWEQIAWFASLLKENVDHNVIMLHISYVGDSVSALLNNITLMSKAYNTRSSVTLNGVAYDFSGTSGKVHLVISGHTHEDATYMLNDVPVVITTDLRSGNTPTFDLFAVNYGESKAYLTRVGNGESRVVEIVV
jgi:predicted MPP superfamily phosphohydrolase